MIQLMRGVTGGMVSSVLHNSFEDFVQPGADSSFDSPSSPFPITVGSVNDAGLLVVS